MSRKVVTSAIVIIPPENLWTEIQKLRKLYDKAYERWMPHINLIYPFVPEDQFKSASDKLRKELSNFKSFNLTLKHFGSFSQGANSTFFLDPHQSKLVELQSLLENVFPFCDDLRLISKDKTFHPHLTLGQAPTKRIEGLKESLSSKWKRISFDVTEIHLISRTKDGPFTIKETIPLKVISDDWSTNNLTWESAVEENWGWDDPTTQQVTWDDPPTQQGTWDQPQSNEEASKPEPVKSEAPKSEPLKPEVTKPNKSKQPKPVIEEVKQIQEWESEIKGIEEQLEPEIYPETTIEKHPTLSERTTTTSAIVITIPDDLCSPIQNIREKHDKAYKRWMPHINILFPFIPEDEFEIAHSMLQKSLSDFPPFVLTLDSIRFSKLGNYGVIYIDIDKYEFYQLHNKISDIFPFCEKESIDSSHPHVTLGQFPLNIIEQKASEIQKMWQPLRFEVNSIELISRSIDGSSPFSIKRSIELIHQQQDDRDDDRIDDDNKIVIVTNDDIDNRSIGKVEFIKEKEDKPIEFEYDDDVMDKYRIDYNESVNYSYHDDNTFVYSAPLDSPIRNDESLEDKEEVEDEIAEEEIDYGIYVPTEDNLAATAVEMTPDQHKLLLRLSNRNIDKGMRRKRSNHDKNTPFRVGRTCHQCQMVVFEFDPMKVKSDKFFKAKEMIAIHKHKVDCHDDKKALQTIVDVVYGFAARDKKRRAVKEFEMAIDWVKGSSKEPWGNFTEFSHKLNHKIRSDSSKNRNLREKLWVLNSQRLKERKQTEKSGLPW